MCDACLNSTNTAPWLSADNPKLSEFILVLSQWSVLPCVAAFYVRYGRGGTGNKGLDGSTKLCLMYAAALPQCVIVTTCAL